MTDTVREYPFFVGENGENPDQAMVRSPYDGDLSGSVRREETWRMPQSRRPHPSRTRHSLLPDGARSRLHGDSIEERSEELAAMRGP
jgi:hypothetical protein